MPSRNTDTRADSSASARWAANQGSKFTPGAKSNRGLTSIRSLSSPSVSQNACMSSWRMPRIWCRIVCERSCPSVSSHHPAAKCEPGTTRPKYCSTMQPERPWLRATESPNLADSWGMALRASTPVTSRQASMPK